MIDQSNNLALADTEDVIKEIFNWVNDSYIRIIEDGDNQSFETVNNDFTKKKVREIGQLASYICILINNK